MKTKILVVGLIVITLLFLVIYSYKGYPLVYVDNNFKASYQLSSDMHNPFEDFDFDNGKWEAYLLISRSDYDKLNSRIDPYKIYKSNSKNVLNSLKSSWSFRKLSGDVATVQSTFILKKDGEIVFNTGIVLYENVMGLQSKDFGWIEPLNNDEFIKPFEMFEKSFVPLVII